MVKQTLPLKRDGWIQGALSGPVNPNPTLQSGIPESQQPGADRQQSLQSCPEAELVKLFGHQHDREGFLKCRLLDPTPEFLIQ